MKDPLTKKTVIFVGANSDIAKATIALLESSTSPVLLTRDIERLPADIAEGYECHNCNPCQHSDVNQRFESIAAQHEVDAVVNFCGSIMLKPAALLTVDEWQKTIDINLTTAFNVAHATTKFIKKDCGLVFFSTAAAHLGLPNHEAIAAAKAGVEGLSASIAASYARQNIRSNVIAPGLIESNLTKPVTNSERGKALSLSLHALERLGQPDDIARLVVWLLNPQNNWITGEIFRVDGGLSTTKCYAK